MASPSSSASTRSGSPDDSSTYSDAPVSTVGLFHVPDLPGQVAASWVRRLVAVELEHAGFESANADALDELEGVVFSCESTAGQGRAGLGLPGVGCCVCQIGLAAGS